MTQRKTLIFDLDGTLIHSAPDLHAAVNVALSGLGRECLDLQTIISFIGSGGDTLIRRSLKATGHYGPEVFAEAMTLFLESYGANMTTLTRPYPGVLDCLNRLKDEGAHLGICTNKPEDLAHMICDALGLTHLFDVITGAGGSLPRKPDPQPLLHTIIALGSAPEHTVYVGDSEIDYETALNAGVTFRLFSRGYLHIPLPDLPDDQQFDDWENTRL